MGRCTKIRLILWYFCARWYHSWGLMSSINHNTFQYEHLIQDTMVLCLHPPFTQHLQIHLLFGLMQHLQASLPNSSQQHEPLVSCWSCAADCAWGGAHRHPWPIYGCHRAQRISIHKTLINKTCGDRLASVHDRQVSVGIISADSEPAE